MTFEDWYKNRFKDCLGNQMYYLNSDLISAWDTAQEEYKKKVKDVIQKLRKTRMQKDGRYNIALDDVLKELGLDK